MRTTLPMSRERRHTALLATVLGAIVLAPLMLSTSTQSAAALPPGPGFPGVPAAPVVLYEEDFENSPDTGAPTALVDYVSDPDGYTYVAEGQWADPSVSCNGFVLSGGSDLTGLCNDNAGSQGGLRALADVLGQVNGTSPATNSAVAAYTSGTPYAADQVQFATDGENIPLPTPNRFVTFSVNAAAVSCQAAQPQMMFSVLIGGVETPISGAAINPCTDPRATAYAPTIDPGNPVFFAGEFASDGSFITNGSPVGIVMRNASGATAGNDGAFDDIRLLDVTPQLDKSFTPVRVPVGGISTLTLTVTNTSELASKRGWQFTDSLPEGLVVADPANTGGTCDATTTTSPGSDVIAITEGNLAAGEVSCTITVDVTSETPRGADPSPKVYENCAANISNVIGLDLPACASVEFYSEPHLTLEKTSDVVSPGEPGDIVTYEVTATNDGTGDYTTANPAVVTDDMSGVLDDATYRGDATSDRGPVTYASPKLFWSGALPVGESVTIRYSVQLGSEGDLQVRNVVFEGVPTDPTPECEDPASSEITCDEEEYPIVLTPKLAIDKTSDVVRDARAGQVVQYTVRLENVGAGDYTATNPAAFVDDMSGVLDDARYNADATVSSGAVAYTAPKLSWTGALASGETVELRYTVTLKDGGDRQVRNVAFGGLPTDPTPECEVPTDTPVPCDVVEYPLVTPPSGSLAQTGGEVGAWGSAGAGILVAGAALILWRRLRTL